MHGSPRFIHFTHAERKISVLARTQYSFAIFSKYAFFGWMDAPAPGSKLRKMAMAQFAFTSDITVEHSSPYIVCAARADSWAGLLGLRSGLRKIEESIGTVEA